MEIAANFIAGLIVIAIVSTVLSSKQLSGDLNSTSGLISSSLAAAKG
jgi:hypothetical protein